MMMDVERLAKASPLLSGEGLISVSQAAKAIGMPVESLLEELLNERAELCTQAQHWLGWRVVDVDCIERDFDGTFIINDVESHGVMEVLSSVVRAFDSAVTISGLLTHATATASVFLLPAREAFFTRDAVQVPLLAWMTQKIAVERIRARLAECVLPERRKSVVASLPHVPESSIVLDGITTKHGGKPFSELFNLYRKHHRWGIDQTRRMETEANLFIELMNDPPLGAIELETIHTFAELLSRLPNDIYQSRRKYKVHALVTYDSDLYIS